MTGLDALDGDPVRVTGDLGIAEAVQREAGLPGLGPVARQHIGVGLPCGVVVVLAVVLVSLLAPGHRVEMELDVVAVGVHVGAVVEAAVGVDSVTVADGHPRTGRAAHGQSRPSAHVLAEVVDGCAIAGREPACRRDGPDDPDGRQRLSLQSPRRCPGRFGRLPRAVVEAGRAPAGPLQAGVVGLAVAVVVVGDRPGRGLPGGVADQAYRLAPVELDVELQQGHRPVSVGLAMAGGGRHVVLRAVPAVPEHEPDCVRAGTQVPGHVVGGVEDPRAQLGRQVVVVVGDGRVEHLLADPPPVDVQLVVAQPRHVAPGPDGPVDEHGLGAQQGGGDARRRADPGCVPVPGVQQGHLEGRRRAVGARAAVPVPGLDPPPAAFAAAERLSLVGDGVGRFGGDPARVPPVAHSGVEARPAGADQHPVGRLALAPSGRLDAPAEAGRGLVEAERVDPVLALRIGRGEPHAVAHIRALLMPPSRRPCALRALPVLLGGSRSRLKPAGAL